MKKILFAFCSLALLLNSISINADASNKSTFGNAEIDEAFIELLKTEPDLLFERYDNIIDIQTMELSNRDRSNESIEAYEYDEDGNMQWLEAGASVTKVVYQEETDLSVSENENLSSLYIMTASTDEKTSDGTLTKDGVTLKGYIVWIDHFGTSNELVSFSGSRSGSYSGTADYIGSLRTSGSCAGDFDTSFTDTSLKGKTAYQFSLIINAYTSDGTKVQLMFKTSVFD